MMVVAAGLCLGACGDSKTGAGLPAGFRLPPGGSLEPGSESLNLPGEKKLVYTYADKMPAELADELRAGFRQGGWSITWDKVEGNRYFVSAERGDLSVDTSAFPLEKTTLSITIREEAVAAASPPTATAPTAPPTAPTTGAPAGWPAKFPFLGGERDPGYPPEPTELPEFLYVFKSEQPAAVADRARQAATAAGFICTDGLKFTCLMRADGSQVHVNADVWPDGGTALFVGVMPVLPPELR
jgi:hypothetical protein